MIDWAIAFAHFGKVEGDYLEFGVFRGETMINAWHAARRHGRDMDFYAFDSFTGLPDPSLTSADTGGEFVEGEFCCDRATFEKNIRNAGVNPSRVTIVEGFYEETLGQKAGSFGLRRAAIVWVDCDLYSSTIHVLEFVTDLLVDGSILIFDDWHCFHSRPDKGEQRACKEWLERNAHIRLVPYRDFHWAGASFIVNHI